VNQNQEQKITILLRIHNFQKFHEDADFLKYFM
jgi:hypothetical protein